MTWSNYDWVICKVWCFMVWGNFNRGTNQLAGVWRYIYQISNAWWDWNVPILIDHKIKPFMWAKSANVPWNIWLFPKIVGFPPKSSMLIRVFHCKPSIFGVPSLKLTWHLKMDGWNISFLLGWPIFRCHVSFRECTPIFGNTYIWVCQPGTVPWVG